LESGKTLVGGREPTFCFRAVANERTKHKAENEWEGRQASWSNVARDPWWLAATAGLKNVSGHRGPAGGAYIHSCPVGGTDNAAFKRQL
jgi:hypothetical protein